MSPFLKISAIKYSLLFLLVCIANTVLAQCAVSTQTGNTKVITSTENFQYINATEGNYSLLVQTFLTKKNTTDIYTLKVVYTGNILHANPDGIVLKATDGSFLPEKIKLNKAVKNDNLKFRTKIYTVTLGAGDVEYIKRNNIDAIEISFGSKLNPVVIKVTEPTFLKDQMACVDSNNI